MAYQIWYSGAHDFLEIYSILQQYDKIDYYKRWQLRKQLAPYPYSYNYILLDNNFDCIGLNCNVTPYITLLTIEDLKNKIEESNNMSYHIVVNDAIDRDYVFSIVRLFNKEVISIQPPEDIFPYCIALLENRVHWHSIKYKDLYPIISLDEVRAIAEELYSNKEETRRFSDIELIKTSEGITSKDGGLITFEEIEEIWEVINDPPTLELTDYNVDFTVSHVKIGCQTFSYRTIKQIYKWVKNER